MADPFSEWPDTFEAPASPDPFADWPGSFKKRPATLAALDDDGPNSSPPMDRPGDADYVPGRLHLGNIDLSRRPTVRNADGSISTVRSISASFGHGEVLLPTVSDDGRILSNADAIDAYRKTGRHLGIFDSPDAATAYAQRLHQDQDRLYSGRRDMSQLGAGLRAAGAPPAITPEPEHSPLYNALGLDVMGDTVAGAGRSAVNTVKAIPGSLNRGTGGVESSLGGLARATGQLLQARPPGASDAGLLGLGPALRAPGRFVESLGGEAEDIGGRQSELADAALKGNPEADSIISRAVQGVPMLTGLAATGGGTAGATLGMGLLGAGGGLKQAEEAGATPGQAWAAAGLQGGTDALLGQIGSVPLVGKLLHGVPVEGASDAALALLKQGGMGATQAVAMDVAHGLARRATYAPDLGLSGGEMFKNAASQALLQGAMEAPGIEMGGREVEASPVEKDTPGAPQGALKVPSSPPAVAPFSGTWPDFLASREMDRSDFAVQTPGEKRALRAEYDAALDAHRDQAAAARAAATPPRTGILDQPEPVHPAIEAAVDHVLGSPRIATDIQGSPGIATPPSSAFPSEVYNRLVQGKPLRLAQTDLERDVGQTAKGLWPTGLLKSPADVQLLHDTLASGGDVNAAVTALAKQGQVKAERVPAPAAPQPPIVQFRQDAAAIQDTLPPVAPDSTRLWRGNRPGETGSTRFTDDLPGIALPFSKAYGGPLSYVDVPTAAASGLVSAGGPGEFNLPSELAAAAKPVPPLGSVGAAGSAVTDAGTELPFRYGLVNAPDLVTSHLRLGDGSLQPNPAFPTELQPRDRSRAASALQVSRMAAGLDPERLAESRLASQGAPLVGPDGAVESGNARALAIGAAYSNGPQAAAYRLWLEQNAPRFGLDPAQVSALDQPALVRQRLDVPGLDRVKLALEANQSDVATMSRPERAVVDARAFEEPSASQHAEPAAVVADHLAATLPPEHVAAFAPGDSGAVESPTNATALREALGNTPAMAHAAEGVEGTQRWLLGSALGDQELAQRVATSKDRLLSRLADPLASVAPSLADAPPELRGYLRQAVDAYAATRDAGGTGPEISRLGRLLGADAPEEVHHIASFLSENAQHPEAVAQYLHRVAELHQQSGGATGGEGQLSLSQLLEMAADRDQRQAAGSVIPLESSVPVSKGVIYSPGEAGFIDFRGPRFGEAAPIRRWFTRDGKFAAMGDDLATRTKDLVNEKDFRVKATSTKVVANVRDFGSALDDQMALLKHADSTPPGSPIAHDATREDVLKYLRAGIQGENDLSAVSPALQDATLALRAHLDAQSLAYATRPDLPATLRQVISDNVGSYLPRTFERITDPKGWVKQLKNDPNQAWRVEDAAKWAQAQHPDWSPEEAQGYAWKLLMDDPQAAYAIARGTAAQKAGMGTESRGNLKARLDLPAELDNLLGLHPDPSRSYQIGAMRAVRDLATYDLHSKVAAMGSADPTRPDGLTPDGQRPIFVDRPTPDLPVRVGGKGPLAEKYTSEQVAAAMRATQATAAAHSGFMRMYLLANGAIKTGKIALNVPMGVARNMLTWPSLLLAGGHWANAFPLKYAYETARALPEAIEANLGTREGGVLKLAKSLAYSLPLANGETVGDHLFPQGQKLADLRAEVYRLQEKGILGQSTSADDLRFYTGQAEEPSPGQRGQKVLRDLGGIWSGEHDLGKHIVFKAEVANLKWANPDLSMDEIEKMAADRTLATTPSRSEVSEGIRAIRASPGVSPFPTFAAERFRNMKNNAMLAWEDLNSTNPRQKVLGASRAAGLLSALALAGGGATTALQWLWNTGKEHTDALSEFLPEYLKNHQIAVADRQGGKVRYADVSPTMPLTGVTDPAMALLRGIHQGSTRDGMVDAAEEFVRPFADPEFALKAGIDVMRNREFRGNAADAVLNLAKEHPAAISQRPIYLEGGPPGLAAQQIGKYLWHNAGPSMGLEAERFARANDVLPNTNSRGKRYTNQDEMAALGGVRFNTLDMNSAITSVGYDLKDALTESKRYFSGERSSSQNDPKTVLDARSAANDRWKNAFEIGMKKVAAARQLGIADYAIRQNLHISGVPPLVIGQLMKGTYSALPLRMPYRVPVDYAGAGAAPGGDGE